MNSLSKSILLVEDDRSLRDLMTMILELEGYKVAVAHDGQQAIDHLEKHEVDLVLLDLFMPILDGTHVLHWIRVEKTMETKVLVITAMTDDKTQSSIMAAGANALIKKPLDVDKIIQSVKALLESS